MVQKAGSGQMQGCRWFHARPLRMYVYFKTADRFVSLSHLHRAFCRGNNKGNLHSFTFSSEILKIRLYNQNDEQKLFFNVSLSEVILYKV